MKTLIVSDIHLGRVANEAKLDFLYSLFSSYDHIILNGDFWCYYSTDFKNFLRSRWNVLFPILKKKEAVYIYGNHDRAQWCLEGTEKFSSTQTSRYSFDVGEKKFLIEHGDRPFNKLCINNFLAIKFCRFINRVFSDDWYLRMSSEFFNETIPNFFNAQLKEFLVSGNTDVKDCYYVFGHTHAAEIDQELKFINTGCIGPKKAEFLEIDNKELNLRTHTYK